MRFDSETGQYMMSEEQARIAYAYTQGTSTGEQLYRQFVSSLRSTGVISGGLMGVTESLLQLQSPELYEYNLPITERTMLTGAFTLAKAEVNPFFEPIVRELDPAGIAEASQQAIDVLTAN